MQTERRIVHVERLLFEPQIKEHDANDDPIFYSLPEILQNIKSVSAHRINKLRNESGSVWEKESFDRLIRSEADFEEKFQYICRNPWAAEVANHEQNYRWLWTLENGAARLVLDASGESPDAARGVACAPQSHERASQTAEISGAFAFRLYDEQGFPFDLTD